MRDRVEKARINSIMLATAIPETTHIAVFHPTATYTQEIQHMENQIQARIARTRKGNPCAHCVNKIKLLLDSGTDNFSDITWWCRHHAP